MKIELKKFGIRLISRPEGRDAALVLRNQFLNNENVTEIELDFSEIKIMTPSWLDEVIREILKSVQKENLKFTNTKNSSVKASLETVLN